MNENKYAKSFVHTQARNIRYLFIVDSKIDTDDLLGLFYNNQRLWGGRFNPIVPSYNGEISMEYIELAKIFDPDVVVHPIGYNLEKITDHFSTSQFKESYNVKDFSLEGLNASYLLNTEDENYTLLFESYLYKSMPSLYDFYKLNFGFLYTENNEVTRKFEKKTINRENQQELNEILAFGNLIYISTLSRANVKRPILNSKINVEAQFELIISDDENQFNDLIYFWNRTLYSKYEPNSLLHIYLTRSQLKELLKNPTEAFFTAITAGGPEHQVNIVSHSITEDELNEFRIKLNAWDGIELFKVEKMSIFPFKHDDLWGDNNSYDELVFKQSLNGNEDLIHLPSLSFYNSNQIFGDWAVDILLERTEDIYLNRILLPCKPNLTLLFCISRNGRINSRHQISQFVNYEIKSLDFTIPSDEEIFRNIILKEYDYHDDKKLIEKIEVSDVGMRLSALFNLFDYNFRDMQYFFQNELWINIFSGISIKEDEDRMKISKGVVSFKDLMAEYKDTSAVKNRDFEEASLKEGLTFDLNKLVKSGAYFIGNKIKCENCGSSLWYGLQEISNTFQCKGCMNDIRVPIESPVYYKINDVIKNNLISNSGSKKNTHGNYTVLATLFSLRAKSETSFYFLPSQNYFKRNSNNPFSDIDIICMSDGKLIIGEAKNSFSDFTNREIDNLVFLGDYIDPDVIVLAYNEGDIGRLDAQVQKITDRLKNKNIEVKPLKVADPFFI
ncbi:MAG: hypothetical protein JNJ41_02485 [Bacteroidia bacterium]|nr:hypothetical protein [Bacteroidia bacterium]